MEALLLGFLAGAAVLWLSVFGYVLILAVLATRQTVSAASSASPPAIAVVVPTRNEAALIEAKLADLRRADYPAARLRVVVADGGSSDGTIERVETARRSDPRLDLLRVAGARSKADQLNAVFRQLGEEIIVVTDVDATLAPSCIGALVGTLVADPAAAAVGARIRPASRLLEERIHWWLLNWLWWLEGEALGAAALSGVCYAVRRSAVVPLPTDCTADDIALALAIGASGGRVRICRAALATEVRVPQTLKEFLRFRRRRGIGYVTELLRSRLDDAPGRVRAVRALRLFHFLVMPPLAAATVAAGIVLCTSAYWHLSIAAAAGFIAPALLALGVSTTLADDGRRWWRLGLAAGRLAGLTWFALLAVRRPPLPRLAAGDG
jgi:cellulose synthase/poly-beta-1,6-N-acetylglucosamine synthase-like glycosyltransferase